VNGKLGAILLPALGVALAIGLWWLATAVFPVNAALVPGPGAVGTLLLSKAYP
jgi:NitT/TauT family transport system permease protein